MDAKSCVLLAQVPPSGRHGLAGWVTFREGDVGGRPIDSYAVLFVTAESPPRMAFTIHVPLQGPPRLETFSPPKESLPGVALLHRARQTALAAVPRGQRKLNPVIVPGEALGQPGKIIVYVLAAEQIVGEMVFGIHYRVTVSGDGSTVDGVHPLSKSELVVGPPSSQGVPSGAKEVEVVVTHHLDDTPNETHVFVSLLHGVDARGGGAPARALGGEGHEDFVLRAAPG